MKHIRNFSIIAHIVAGLAAGMGTVAASYGYLGNKTDTASWGAHASINSPLELLQLLQSA